jgi:hypothetical protein
MVSPKSSFGLQLCGALEQLEASGEPVPVRVVLLAPRQPDQSARSGFQALLQERSVVQFQWLSNAAWWIFESALAGREAHRHRP